MVERRRSIGSPVVTRPDICLVLTDHEREGRTAGGSSSHHHQSVSKLHFSIKSSQKLEEQSNDFMIFDSPVLRVPNYSL